VTTFGCAAYVNGVRLADTDDEYLASAPTALEGLRVTWGRDNVNDQPEPGSCAFTVRDRDPDADLLALVHAGDLIDVYCETAGGSAPVDVAVEGGFEQTPPAGRVAVTNATAGQSSVHVYDGARSLLFTGRSTLPAGSFLIIPPAPWAAAATGWDAAVPPVTAGDTWTVRLRARAGDVLTPLTVKYRLTTLATPVKPGAPYRYVLPEQSAAVPAGAWTVLELARAMTAADAGRWVGMYVSVEAPTWTGTAGTWAAAAGTWGDRWPAVYLDRLEVIAPPQSLERRAVFRGRITDLALEAAAAGSAMTVTAADLTADLANDLVSDQPWPESTLGDRGAAIQARTRTAPLVVIDPRPAALMVTWRDVDASGFYLWLEDTWARDALAHLTQNPGTGLITIAGDNPNTAAGVVLNSCDVLRDAIRFGQDTGDAITIADVAWNEQTTEGGLPAAPLERHEVSQDDAGLARYGPRRASITTQLSRQADALGVVSHVLARAHSVQWHATGVTWDFDVSQEWDDGLRAAALTLLDGTSRIGCPLTITDLPAWVPESPALSAYVDGGQYTFAGGRWLLELNITSAAGAGQSIIWNAAAPGWRWRDFDPTISWAALWGVGS
jgi:hypothetical protein